MEHNGDSGLHGLFFQCLCESNDVICLQETHEKLCSFRFYPNYIRSFTWWEHFIKDQANAGGSARNPARILETSPRWFWVYHWDLNIFEPEEGRFSVTKQTFSDGGPGWSATVGLSECNGDSPATLYDNEAAQDGTLRITSRIDRASINIPVAEAREFHSHSHVTNGLGDGSKGSGCDPCCYYKGLS